MRYLFLSLCLCIGLSMQADKIEFRDLSFKEGLEAAAEEGKPVFIDCFTTWCGPCKWMSANIFTDSKVAQYYNENYICLKIDMEKGEGVDIAKKYGIRAYPTLLYLDAKGERLLVSVGADRDPQSYIDNGEQAKDPERNLPYLLSNVDENFEDQEFMYDYFMTTSSANMIPEGMVDRYFAQFSVEEWLDGPNWEILTRTADDINGKTFRVILDNASLVAEAQPEDGASFIEQTVFYALANQLYRARNEEAEAKYQATRDEILNIGFPGSEKIAFRLQLIGFQKSENYEAYGAALVENVEKFFWDDANELNNVAWTAFEKVESPEVLKRALLWAKRAVELSPEHHIMDTYAHLLHVNRQTEEALQVELKALELAQEQGASTKSYQEFIDEMQNS